MENPAKALTLLVCIGILSCRAKDEIPGAPSNPAPHALKSDTLGTAFPKPALSFKRFIGNGLYRDSAGNIHLKTKNRKVRNPSNENKNWPDSIYHSKVFMRESGIYRGLLEVVDTSTFVQIDDMGVYFEDSGLIYVYSIWPYPDQFFALGKSGARFLDAENEYLLAGGKLYSHGQTVEGIDATKATVIRFRRTDKDGFIEFVTDGRVLIHGYKPMDERRLSSMEGLSDRDKESMRTRFFRRNQVRTRELSK